MLIPPVMTIHSLAHQNILDDLNTEGIRINNGKVHQVKTPTNLLKEKTEDHCIIETSDIQFRHYKEIRYLKYIKNQPTDSHHYHDVLKSVEDYSSEHKIIDYDGLLFRYYEKLNNQGDNKTYPPFTAKIAGREKLFHLKHILVDEFQDMDHTIIEILNISKYDSLMLFGDDDQNIYSYSSLPFPKSSVPFPRLVDKSLSTNYRSEKGIQDACTQLLSNDAPPNSLPDDYVYRVFSIDCYTISDVHDTITEILNFFEIRNKTVGVLFRTNLSARKYSKDHPLTRTIHKSKGHEYDCVVVVHFHEMMIPFYKPKIVNLKKEVEDKRFLDEKRIAYVGISRAKKYCILLRAIDISASGSAFSECDYKITRQSRFLGQMGPYVAKVDSWMILSLILEQRYNETNPMIENMNDEEQNLEL